MLDHWLNQARVLRHRLPELRYLSVILECRQVWDTQSTQTCASAKPASCLLLLLLPLLRQLKRENMKKIPNREDTSLPEIGSEADLMPSPVQ